LVLSAPQVDGSTAQIWQNAVKATAEAPEYNRVTAGLLFGALVGAQVTALMTRGDAPLKTWLFANLLSSLVTGSEGLYAYKGMASALIRNAGAGVELKAALIRKEIYEEESKLQGITGLSA
jgi:hypothetical protein